MSQLVFWRGCFLTRSSQQSFHTEICFVCYREEALCQLIQVCLERKEATKVIVRKHFHFPNVQIPSCFGVWFCSRMNRVEWFVLQEGLQILSSCGYHSFDELQNTALLELDLTDEDRSVAVPSFRSVFVEFLRSRS